MNLDYDISIVRGIGLKTKEELNTSGIYTILDLLYSFPKAYDIYEENPKLLRSEEYTVIKGSLDSNAVFIKNRTNSNAIIFYLNCYDNRIKCIYFGGDFLRYKLYKGSNIALYGKYNSFNKEFVVKKLFLSGFETKIECDYKIKNVKDHIIQKAISDIFSNNISFKETLPNELITKYKLYNISKYLYTSHLPANREEVRQVLRRRKYEEFFWYSLRLEFIKSIRADITKPKRIINKNKLDEFITNLSFSLTEDQKKVLNEIEVDISSTKPMNRLVQGDVGCGKSIISVYSAYATILCGYQAAIMVPTELLANQQFQAANELLSKYGIITELLTSSRNKKDKNDILERLQSGRINLIIGTHSLIEDNVKFDNLGIVIIDEQHKFGVKQRQKLIDKYKYTDCLYLTATPIPRSLGLTIFGDLDISSIHTMPEGRLKTITKIVKYSQINGLMKSINKELEKNNQIYVVTPLIDDINELNVMDINRAYNLFKDYFPDKKILIVHGKMKDDEKNKNMVEFSERKADILISTTVIEVGVNVKRATVMVICDADRFGLAGLHQLRGRVGRSIYQSYCVLLTNDPENQRLKTIESTTDGFMIAEADLKQRGPGDYLGDDQSGYFTLDYADFYNDIKIYECAKEDAKVYITKFKKKEIESNIFNDIIKNETINKNKNN